jgi:hypothetical protein
MRDYQESVKREPLIPAGVPLDFVPVPKAIGQAKT